MVDVQPGDDSAPSPFQAFVARAREGRNSLPRLLVGTVIVVAVWPAGTLALLAGGGLLLALGWWPEGWVGSTGDFLNDFIGSRVGLAVAVLTLGSIWIGVWLAVRLVHRRRLATLFGASGRIARGDFARAMVATAIAALLISLLNLWVEPRVTRTDLAIGAWLALLPAVAAILLIQTSAEEIFFRGYLLQSLAARFRSPLVWAVLPAVVFAFAHWAPSAQPWMNAVIVLSIFLFAMSAVLMVWLTGNLGAAMGMHFANNLVALLLLSGGTPGTSLALWVTPELDDPSWTVTDAAIGGVLQLALTAIMLALLLWRGSPLRIGADAVQPRAAPNDAA